MLSKFALLLEVFTPPSGRFNKRSSFQLDWTEILLQTYEDTRFEMQLRISIRVRVRPSVRRPVGWLVPCYLRMTKIAVGETLNDKKQQQ